jgi:peptidoglycan/LPS O-acetylase OafA/YrhL
LCTFLIRRWMRTVPPYLFALIAITFMLAAFGSREFLLYVFYVQNLFEATGANDYFPIAWSLSVEEWAYLSFAVLIGTIVAVRIIPRDLLLVAGFVVIACAFLRFLFPHDDSWGASVRRVIIFRLDSVAAGVLLRLVSDRACLPKRARPAVWGSL